MRQKDPRFTELRGLAAGDRPRRSRSRSLLRAKAEVMANHDRLLEQERKRAPSVERHNLRVQESVDRKWRRFSERSEHGAKPVTTETLLALDNELAYRQRNAYTECYYIALNNLLDTVTICLPDVDHLTPDEVRPGWGLRLDGTCFGPSQGKVLLRIQEGSIVELEVEDWTATSVTARLNSIIGGLPLRPYYGKIWIQTGTGRNSNEWNIMFYPLYGEYLARWSKEVSGGLFGASEDGQALRNRRLGDSDFTIVHVGRSHSGDGWSKLKIPHATGQDLKQGWHIGVGAFGTARMSVFYHVNGPRNIMPPAVDGLSAWVYAGPAAGP